MNPELILELTSTGERRRLRSGQMTIGRAPGNDWVLDDDSPIPTVSRQHCVITAVDHGFTVTDLKSTNGTYLGACKLDPHVPVALDGSEFLQIGPYTLTVTVEAASSSPIPSGLLRVTPSILVKRPIAPPAPSVPSAEEEGHAALEAFRDRAERPMQVRSPDPVYSQNDPLGKYRDPLEERRPVEPDAGDDPKDDPRGPGNSAETLDEPVVHSDTDIEEAPGPAGIRPKYDTAPRKEPWPQIRDARFTIYHPKKIAPEQWDTLLVYAHISEMLYWVFKDAQARLGQSGNYDQRSIRAKQDIAEGTEIVVVPELPGCQFNPPADRFHWFEDVHRREFRLRPTTKVLGFELGKAVNGGVAFYIGPVLISEVEISAFISNQADDVSRDHERSSQSVVTTSIPYNAVFVSYAHNDSFVVEHLGMAYKALGIKFLRDQEVLRSGEKWSPTLLSLIEQADVFQLCWSQAARQSRYVEKEWRHALRQNRDSFIRPLYWQKPMPEPPKELEHIHFVRFSAEQFIHPDNKPLIEYEIYRGCPPENAISHYLPSANCTRAKNPIWHKASIWLRESAVRIFKRND